jgi:hypothetical protein
MASPLATLTTANSTLLRDLRSEFREIGMLASMAEQRRRADVLSVAARSASSSLHTSPVPAHGGSALAASPEVRTHPSRDCLRAGHLEWAPFTPSPPLPSFPLPAATEAADSSPVSAAGSRSGGSGR